MIIKSVFKLNQPADQVYAMLLDLDAVTPCIPGATVGAERADGARAASVEVRFGPMRFSYAGTVRIAETDTKARRAVLQAVVNEESGEGDAKAQIEMVVVELGPRESRVDVINDLAITGGAAQMGTGMIEDFAEEMLDDFVTRVGQMFDAQPTSSAPVPASGNGAVADAVADARAPHRARPEALSGVSLVLRVARRRIRRRWRELGRWLRSPTRGGGSMSGGHRRLPEPDYDLVVVGSGSGALAGAIAAHESGLRVVIYEKAPVVGGGTAYSGGVVWAPCNHVMRRKGIPDSVEDACDYLHAASNGRGDDVVQHRYVTEVAGIIEQVERWTGISWVIWTGQPDYYTDLPGARLNGRAILQHPNSATDVLGPAETRYPELALVRPTPHMDFVPGFQTTDRRPRDSWLAGRSIIGGLWKVILERGIEYHVSTPVIDLVRDGVGAVVGVRVQPSGGAVHEVRSHAVLLNTGGFDWNETLAHRYLPGPSPHPQTPPSNTGDGHIMAMDAGAGTALMDKAVWHPSIQIPGDSHDEGQPLYRMFNLELSKPHCIVVNRTGRRFVTEAAYYALADAWAHIDMLTQTFPNVPSYFVCDATYREKYGLPGVRQGDPIPEWIHSADSLEDLAAQLRVDPAGLSAEVELYNSDSVSGTDSRFGRGTTAYEQYWGDPEWDGPNPTMGPVEKPPYYGFPLHLAHAGTRGGVITSRDGEVLRADGTVIPGLYACGNTAANVLFGNGYASGSAVGSSLVFGYLAAKHLVAKRAGVAASVV
jgi:succinate dehydrogenase/fumarate reductase flavoprotein subunit/carbon monoxide dehydrogenase subunit G